jgi:hypothetical protein
VTKEEWRDPDTANSTHADERCSLENARWLSFHKRPCHREELPEAALVLIKHPRGSSLPLKRLMHPSWAP